MNKSNIFNNQEIISASNLNAAYGKKTIWKNANFKINRGEFVVLLGPNGGGKTTLFRLILGLLSSSSGDIQLFDSKPSRGNPRIGYIPQRRPIDSEVKIEALEFVKLGLIGNKWGFTLNESKKVTESALEALKRVNGSELAYRPIGELSGGELQRIFLAQALISEPELLLLDEPMANLDIKREIDFVELLNEVVKSQNIAVMLITHDINPLLPFVDKIIYIANGQVETGTVKEVINSDRLSLLYGIPIEVLHDSQGRIAILGIEGEVHHD